MVLSLLLALKPTLIEQSFGIVLSIEHLPLLEHFHSRKLVDVSGLNHLPECLDQFLLLVIPLKVLGRIVLNVVRSAEL